MVHKVLEAFEGHVREAYPCIAGAVGEGVLYATVGSLVNILGRASNKDYLVNTIKWIHRIHPEFQLIFFQDLLKTDARDMVVSSGEFLQWAVNNRDIFLDD